MGTTMRTQGLIAAAAAVLAVPVLGLRAEPAFAAYAVQVKSGTLKITGDAASDKLGLEADTTSVFIDVGDDGTPDFTVARSTFTAVVVNAGGGDDQIRLGNSGNGLSDKAVTLNGGGGNDTILGGPGNETLIGGAGNDVVDGNIGLDTALLGGGNDTYQWDPGDNSDTVEGQTGTDTIRFNGANINERIELSANGSRLRLTRDIAAITMDAAGMEEVTLNVVGGTDLVTVDDLAATGVTEVDANLGFPAGSSTPDGAADTVVVNATSGANQLSLSNGGGGLAVLGLAAVTRVTGDESTDAVAVHGLDGDDTMTATVGVHAAAHVDFDGGPGSDTSHYDGTIAADQLSVLPNGAFVATSSPGSVLLNSGAVENLDVATQNGDDAVSAGNGIATLTQLTLDGGNGNDTLLGGDGNDRILGGKGADLIDGNRGNDLALMGDGSDTYQWDPGDANDIVEGQAGIDTIRFNGANINEQYDLSANGSRLRLLRDIGAVTMDAAGIERVLLNTVGGVDTITLNDLSGTGVTDVAADLGFPVGTGTGDGSADTVVVNGTAGPDTVHVTSTGAEVAVSGLAAHLRITGSEGALDRLRVQTLAGKDTVSVAVGVENLIIPIVDLGTDQ